MVFNDDTKSDLSCDSSSSCLPLRSSRLRGSIQSASKRRAFTLVELLIVIGIVATLIGILLPALNTARQAARAATCANNLRQLVTAVQSYALAEKGFAPPAHYYFSTRNLHRWHGTRPNGATPFDFNFSPLKSYLQTPVIKACPSFEPAKAGFEASAGGYGYNAAYIGSSVGEDKFIGVSLPIAEYERVVTNVPARIASIRRPAEKIAFADSAMANPGLIEYSFVEPPLFAGGGTTSPSMHFRHGGSANVGWLDGHVSRERFEWTYPTNVYGADNKKNLLGFFGPRDNRLFRRD